MNTSVEQKSAADGGAEGHRQRVPKPARSTEPGLAAHCRSGVIVDTTRDAKPTRERLSERQTSEIRQVRAADPHRAVTLNLSSYGNADTLREFEVSYFTHDFLDCGEKLGRRHLSTSFPRCFGYDLALGRDADGPEVRSSDIESDDRHLVWRRKVLRRPILPLPSSVSRMSRKSV